MSESHDYHDNKQGPWGKLYAYLNFRRLLQGLWIEDPPFWFKAITDDDIIIRTGLYTDSGGGPLTGYDILVFNRYRERKPMLRMSLSFDSPNTDTVFIERMKLAYSYMKSYAEGKNWLERACDRYDDDCVDGVLWDKIFGPLHGIGKVSDKDLGNMKCFNYDSPYGRWADEISILLDGITRFPSENIDITFHNKTAVLVKKARQWALLALLEMQRYYYTSC